MPPPSTRAVADSGDDSDADRRADGEIISSVVWPTLPDLQKFTASTMLGIGRQFYIYPPDFILKLGTDKGEAAMTKLAHDILGSIAPRVHTIVSVEDLEDEEGIIITRQPGVPLEELWPDLGSEEREVAKTSLSALLVRMRERTPGHDVNYYGRPGQQPYITAGFASNHAHDFCPNLSDWNKSRINALRKRAEDGRISSDRLHQLKCAQEETTLGTELVNRPVLTHGDLSDRNILVDPDSYEVTGLIDWELANVVPAYFEYVSACLSPGHEAEWRQELLDVLRRVLRIECEQYVAHDDQLKNPALLFEQTLAGWNKLVDVERACSEFLR